MTPVKMVAIIRSLASRPGGPVRLADLRNHVPVSGVDFNKLLIDMDDDRLVQLEPDPDRGGLADADHDVAIRLAGEPKHLVRVVERG